MLPIFIEPFMNSRTRANRNPSVVFVVTCEFWRRRYCGWMYAPGSARMGITGIVVATSGGFDDGGAGGDAMSGGFAIDGASGEDAALPLALPVSGGAGSGGAGCASANAGTATSR